VRTSLRASLAHLAVTAAALLWLALAALPAQAQRSPSSRTEQEARTLFQSGLAAASEERWADALELFRRSRALVERPSVLYNEAQVLVRLGRFVEARASLRAFQAASGASTDEERARLERARALLTEIEAQIATLVVRVDPPGAILEVDGEPSATTGPIRTLELDPGRHAITVRAQGRDPRSFTVALLSGTRSSETVTLAESSATRLVVEAGQADARIEVDGEVVGTGRAEASVASGRHVVRVVPAEGPARTREVDVAAGTTLTVDLGPSSVSGGSDDVWIGLGIAGALLLVGAVVAGVAVATYDPGVEPPIPGQVGPGGVVSALSISF
jgi:hypothetical protein